MEVKSMSGKHTVRSTVSPVSPVGSAGAQVVNLTEQLVVEEADALLATCTTEQHRQIFALPSERQRLIRYALNRVNKVYLLVHHPQLVQRQYEPAIAHKPQIRQALREGLQAIVNVYAQPPKRSNAFRSLSPLTTSAKSASVS